MIKHQPLQCLDELSKYYRIDESLLIDDYLKRYESSEPNQPKVQALAYELVKNVRSQKANQNMLDAFLAEYDLSSQEGVALMCLAEALLRVPDKATRTELINDKIGGAEWINHFQKSESSFVNAATWGLMLTGKIVDQNSDSSYLGKALKGFCSRSTQAVVRAAVAQAMKILGQQFVMGQTIEEALERAEKNKQKLWTQSYDMLGEAARTQQEAEDYYQSYLQAIKSVGEASRGMSLLESPGVSIKLSALHPCYDYLQEEEVVQQVSGQLLKLVEQAKHYDISVTIDAEEADRLMLSLRIIEDVFLAPSLNDWEGFGLAVQAYQKRGLSLVKWCVDLAKRANKQLMVRLVKGAYWDSEIKLSQTLGLSGYPVFTRKESTDLSYLVCAQYLLSEPELIYSQFASHNAHTVASIITMASAQSFEFQCLHGMGSQLYHHVVDQYKIRCRVYAPVGGHQTLLAYLVRRLLENGANSSFVNRIADEALPIEEVIQDPVAELKQYAVKSHPKIPLPEHLYGTERKNALGLDLSDHQTIKDLQQAMQKKRTQYAKMKSPKSASKLSVLNPAHGGVLAQVATQDQKALHEAFQSAKQAQKSWALLPIEQRAGCLRMMADALSDSMSDWISLLVDEAGKTLPDAVAEVREAIDFCRYYAMMAEQNLVPEVLPGPTGELNQLSYRGRGVMLCISPWNFPLAIFLGQVVACLVTGNAVIAKPAEQTPLIALEAIAFLHRCGVPEAVCQCVVGGGELGAEAVKHPDLAGVLFTGSTVTAKAINQTLAARSGAILPLIAETGGQNVMIVDSTALPEQLILDIMTSAFGSAGQRCSALRVLCVQEEVADRVITLIKGAMDCLIVGHPELLATDVGPVVDQTALDRLLAHKKCRHVAFDHTQPQNPV